MQNTANWPQASPPRRIENLLIVVTVIHDVLAQQQVQVVMTVFMYEVIDEIKVVAIKTVDERKPGPMTITETHNACGLERAVEAW
jgi:hypothetical protein